LNETLNFDIFPFAHTHKSESRRSAASSPLCSRPFSPPPSGPKAGRWRTPPVLPYLKETGRQVSRLARREAACTK
jgi:hypothetical protein